MGVMIMMEENPPKTPEGPYIEHPFYTPVFALRQSSDAQRIEASTISVVRNLFSDSELRNIPGITIRQLDEQFSEFDPAEFDPINITFEEACRTLAQCDLDKHGKFVRDTILKYSLCIRGFPDCHNEDLMLAVYFYFEEKFKIKAKLELCIRFDHKDEKNLVGVIFCSLRTRDAVHAKANATKCSVIKITSSEAFFWIPDGFCGP